MIGASLYAAKNNMNCTEKPKRIYRKSAKIKLFNLIIGGYMQWSKYEDDYFISILQSFFKKGYPLTYCTTQNLQKFFNKMLFGVCGFHFESLFLNHSEFNIFEWRKQFDLFSEIRLKNLNYYSSRAAMPLPNFTRFGDIKKKIFADYDDYGDKHIKFRYSPNECHKDAVWILNPYIKIYADEFVYSIPYGCKDDRLNYEKNKAHSSWSVDIKSRENENYVDFCFRLYNNYNKILNGNYYKG